MITPEDNAIPSLKEVEEVCRQSGFILAGFVPDGPALSPDASGSGVGDSNIPGAALPAPDHCASCTVPPDTCAKDTVALGTYSQAALRGLTVYLELLYDWGKEMNLVGKRNWRDTLEVLIMDSFHLAEFLRGLQKAGFLASGKDLESWDLGAGAGLPGIPLRLLWQDGTYFLVEERKKRVLFMENFLARNPLPRTQVFCGLAEKFMKTRKADLIVSRAFMPYAKLLPLVRDKLKRGVPGPQGHSGGMTIIMSNDPAPKDLAGWRLVGEQAYDIKGGLRYFWALRPE